MSQKIAIVGSRRFQSKVFVESIMENCLEPDDVVVSGGCRGVDTWAIEKAKSMGRSWVIFWPDPIDEGMDYYEICEVYYERNRQMVEFADEVWAFVKDDRGGTMNTIEWARKMKKPVTIYKLSISLDK